MKGNAGNGFFRNGRAKAGKKLEVAEISFPAFQRDRSTGRERSSASEPGMFPVAAQMECVTEAEHIAGLQNFGVGY